MFVLLAGLRCLECRSPRASGRLNSVNVTVWHAGGSVGKSLPLSSLALLTRAAVHEDVQTYSLNQAKAKFLCVWSNSEQMHTAAKYYYYYMKIAWFSAIYATYG